MTAKTNNNEIKKEKKDNVTDAQANAFAEGMDREDTRLSTGAKVAIAAAGTLAVAGIGYGIYRAVRKEDAPVLEAPAQTIE